MPNELILRAPISGIVYPLERVPDPVFAQKLMGDGLSIDPIDGTLRAPCAGEVITLHPASHALTLRTNDGVEVLMHIGIDTVSLKGVGFTPRVKKGDKVETGAPLIEFDLDKLATTAKSLLTEVIISNGDAGRIIRRASGQIKAGNNLFGVSLSDGAAKTQTATEGALVTSPAILVANKTGLHVRPAAVLASVAKSFKSEIKVKKGESSANARSVTSLMALEVFGGDKLILVAKGPDAKEAVEKLSNLITAGLGDEGHPAAPAPATTTIAK